MTSREAIVVKAEGGINLVAQSKQKGNKTKHKVEHSRKERKPDGPNNLTAGVSVLRSIDLFISRCE